MEKMLVDVMSIEVCLSVYADLTYLTHISLTAYTVWIKIASESVKDEQ